MSQNFTAFPTLPYVGAPYGQPTNLHAPTSAMDKQSKTVRLDIPWTFYGASVSNENIGVSVNLQATQSGVTAALDAIRSVYIDNTFSPVPVFIQFPDTLFTVVCPAFAVVMSPVFTFVQQFTVYAQGFQLGQAPTTSVFCSNTLHDGFYVPTTQSGVTPAVPVTYALTDRYITGFTGNFTIPTVQFGDADPDRWIVLTNSMAWQSSAVNISAVTIGGIAAVRQQVQVAVVGGLSAISCSSEIWMAQVPTGTSGSVVFVLTNTNNVGVQPMMDFYAVQHLGNPLYNQALGAKAAPAASLTVTTDTKANGLIIGTSCSSVSPNGAWQNLSQDDSRQISSNIKGGSASFLTSDNVQRVIGNTLANAFCSVTLA